MKFLDLFTHQHIRDVLQTTLSYSDESEILFFIDQTNVTGHDKILTVKVAGVEHKYVLVKIPKNLKSQENNPLKNSNVLYPAFIIENNNKECYAAFASERLEHFESPEQNSIECLNVILQNLAEHQAADLTNSEEVEKSDISEYDLKSITNAVTSLDFFKDLDTAVIKESVENLQIAFNKLRDGSNLLIKSIGCPFAKNVYINQEIGKSVFLNVSLKKLAPPAYDALLYIFALSDEKFRQEHFEELILYYFESLTNSLRALHSNIADKLTRSYSEPQVKVLLPIVKFQIASSFLQLEDSLKCQALLKNIFYFLKYPLVNQEDIYETVKNKLLSSDYDLVDYSLVCLSENNGHLGEYFHLDIKVKVQGKEQVFQLFAKVLIPATDLMKDILENGPAKKEDFFYRILIPLYTKYGLDSLLDFAPKCYLSRINWLLILDDLSRLGYVGLKPNSVLNYEGLKLCLKNLAKFHACSYILEEMLSKESKKIVRLNDDYGDFVMDTSFVYEDGHILKGFYDKNLESLYYVVEKCPEITKRLKLSPEELRARLKSAFMAVFSKAKHSDRIRSVINHGDLYAANMLFKFGKDRIPTSGILIDFQLLRYFTPSYDLLFFLFFNSTKETRDKYLNVLIEDYYHFLSDNIKKFNFDPEIVFPKEAFDKNIKLMMSVGVIGAFMYAHIIHIDSDFREEIFHDQKKYDYYLNDHKDELVDLSWTNDHYRTILKGLVEDLVDILEKEF